MHNQPSDPTAEEVVAAGAMRQILKSAGRPFHETEHVNDNDNPFIRTLATRARHEDRAAPQEPPNDD